MSGCGSSVTRVSEWVGVSVFKEMEVERETPSWLTCVSEWVCIGHQGDGGGETILANMGE